ncbi:DUF2796 domain-containing protein [Vibrio sp. FNV 38]|nr:DUF2796 domain-containing protein [Vibrio sp. FNV 38]
MKNTKLNAITMAAISSCAFFSVTSQANDEFRQHGAHVHGEVELNIAQDANELLIEIIAPGADVVGFERAPTTEQEKQTLQAAIALLEQPMKLFTLPASASCSVEYVAVSHSLGGDEHDHGEHDHAHDEKHDHDAHDHEDHDHAHHDDHAHDEKHDHDAHDHEDHDHAHHSGHGEFTIEYRFSCENIDQLKQVETSWFDKFEQTEKVSVNILTDRVQGATTLNASSQGFEL